MEDREFHAYVESIATHMPAGWSYDAKESKLANGELRAPRLTYRLTTAAIWFGRDDREGKFSAHVETNRMIEGRNASASQYRAHAGFTQGRAPKQVAAAIVRKGLPELALQAAIELDGADRSARESKAERERAVSLLNASGLLTHRIERRPHEPSIYFYGKGSAGYIDDGGSVRLERVDVDVETALKLMAVLAASKG